jgi:20S proteasome alpha/beta subunit
MIEARDHDFARLVGFPTPSAGEVPGEIHGTTVISLRHKEGAFVLADRRATMGSLIMFEQA